MSDIFVADIETIPNMDVVDLIPEPKAHGAIKDSVKIAADIEKKKAEAVGKMGLDPNFGRICVIGYAERVDGEISTSDHHLWEATDKAERELLAAFWEKAKMHARIGTFNGAGFDIPFIMRRSWLLGVKPTRTFETVAWKCATGEANHVDIRLVLSGGDAKAKGTMDLYGKLKLGHGKTNGMDGSQVWEYWQAERMDEIRDYCKDDCATTLELLESLYGYYIAACV